LLKVALKHQTTKTGRHDVAEILLKVVLNTINQINLWFSPGTPASSTTKTGRHDIAEILLKVTLYTKNQNQIKSTKLFMPSMVVVLNSL